MHEELTPIYHSLWQMVQNWETQEVSQEGRFSHRLNKLGREIGFEGMERRVC